MAFAVLPLDGVLGHKDGVDTDEKTIRGLGTYIRNFCQDYFGPFLAFHSLEKRLEIFVWLAACSSIPFPSLGVTYGGSIPLASSAETATWNRRDHLMQLEPDEELQLYPCTFMLLTSAAP